jgi:putative membrane protein
MIKFAIHFLVNIIFVYAIQFGFVNSTSLGEGNQILGFVILLSIMNWIVVPIIKIFTFPINFLTLGIFNLILSVLVTAFSLNISKAIIVQQNTYWLFIVVFTLSLSLVQGAVSEYLKKQS